MNYYQKYLKYKQKYMELKGGKPFVGTIYLLIGPPGSGKSTISKKYVPFDNVCESDKLPNYYTNGIINFGMRNDAHKFSQKCVENQMIRKEPNIVVANPFIVPLNSEFGIVPYANLAIKYNYSIQLILPNFGILHFELPGTVGKSISEIRVLQINHLKNARNDNSKDKEGYKNIPGTIIEKMVSDYDELKPKFLLLQTFNNPIAIKNKIDELTK
jgi:predicted kinase